ncbi:hypothetical protein [Erythrobacter sp. BLCC-B19]|uniref:hypothetical protein n=1 Tax=Erythrobacter sp. BLCC-B19 TaxID=3025315 RepID=UPI0023630111|nr:hypothetical protein [Erythrobacter sp. BLCC-B19]WDA42012.1 hypothetical protein PS060_04155 [Erythrobacter sp. BLCC-B19]
MTIATRATWKHLPMPAKRQALYLALSFDTDEVECIRRGFIPRDMDDKWSIFVEDDWLYFHRSWTGFCIFAVRLEPAANGVVIREGWASRDPEQYHGSSAAEEQRQIAALIDSLLHSRKG